MSKSFLILMAGIVLSCPVASAQTPNGPPPLWFYAHPFSDLIDQYPPTCEGESWPMRQTIGAVIDFVMTPPAAIENHPLLHPEIGPFISRFHRVRLEHVVKSLENDPPPAEGVRVYKLYSSGWVVRGSTMTFAVDFSDGPFFPTAEAPGLFGVEPDQLDRLAAQLDAYFVTHSHIDHLSPYLASAMAALGKPVYVPTDLAFIAVVSGLPGAYQLQVPPSGSDVTIGSLTFNAWHGHQYATFTDLAAGIPDLSNPFNVQNNCYMFEMDGVTMAHLGDNNDIGVVDWAQNRAADGWSMDVAFNLGLWTNDVTSVFEPDLKCLSHELEFHHLGGNFLNLNIGTQPSSTRRVLIWGESLDICLELQH